jgi:hypothetical protein
LEKHSKSRPGATGAINEFQEQLRRIPAADYRQLAVAIGTAVAGGIDARGSWRTNILHDLGFQVEYTYDYDGTPVTVVLIEVYETKSAWWHAASAAQLKRELERLTSLARARLMALG